MMREIKIAITAASYSGNKGAAAMLQSSMNQLQEAYGTRLRIYLMSVYPSEDRLQCPHGFVDIIPAQPQRVLFLALPCAVLCRVFGWYPPIKALLLKNKILKTYQNTDLVIDEAGISFSDSRGVILNVYAFACAAIPMLMGVPVVKYAQALGPFHHVSNRFLAKLVLPRMQLVIARGRVTYAHLRAIGIRDQARLYADGAFTMPPAPEIEKRVRDRCEKEGFSHMVALSISSVVERKCKKAGIDYRKTMVAFIAYLTGRGYQVYLFANAARIHSKNPRNNDLMAGDAIARAYRELGDGGQGLIWEHREMGAEEIRAYIGQCELLVASRFHAMIFALSKQVPVMLVGWSHKYQEVMEQFGLGEYAADFSGLSQKELRQSFERLLENEEEIRHKIKESLPAVEKSSRKNIRHIVKILDGILAGQGCNRQGCHRSGAYRNGCSQKKGKKRNPNRGNQKKENGRNSNQKKENGRNSSQKKENGRNSNQKKENGRNSNQKEKDARNGNQKEKDVRNGYNQKKCDKKIKGKQPARYMNHVVNLSQPDYYIGSHMSCRMGYAMDPKIRANAASGGMVTALLCNLLKNHAIDGAWVVKTAFTKNGGLTYEAYIATSPQQIREASSSVYMKIPMMSHLDMLRAFDSRLAVVLTPCMMRAFCQILEKDGKLREKVVLKIGLFCSGAHEVEATEYALDKCHIPREGAKRLYYRRGHWRGVSSVVYEDGSRREFSYAKSICAYKNAYFFIGQSCLTCKDQFAKCADISFGDVWLSEMKKDALKYTGCVIRSENAYQMLRRAQKQGDLRTYPMSDGQMLRSQMRALTFKYRSGRWNHRLAGRLSVKNRDFSMEHPKMLKKAPMGVIYGYMCMIRVLLSW